MKRSVSSVAAFTAAVLFSSSSVAAVGPDTFIFTGNCSDCSGATATLVNFGTTVNAANFISFTYSSSVLSFTVNQGTYQTLQGDLSGVMGPKFVNISRSDYIVTPSANGAMTNINATPVIDLFISRLDGTFDVSRNAINMDTGLSHSWTNPTATAAVPEPATWALMVGGFGLVGSAMRQRQKVKMRVFYSC